jgi:glycosyltransferase involved in cell wall biosynthesis
MESRVKLVICWSHISGYMASCWRALSEIEGLESTIVAFQPHADGTPAPFADALMAGLNCRYLSDAEAADPTAVRSLVESLNPDIVMVAGWLLPAYVQLPFSPALAGKRFVMTMDTPYRGTLRQRLARYKLASFFRQIDRVIVPGERAWQYARRLGFPEWKIRRGMYGIDYEALQPLHQRRIAEAGGQWPKRFLYVGRYADAKGIDILVEAYRIYCRQTPDPWPLTTCGAGEMAHLLANVPNLTDRGFVQPTDQPVVWTSHGAFVIASRSDPWPLVIVEACAAGLPIVHTEACGSSVELVRPYYNGVGVATGDAESLAAGMLWIDRHHARCAEMGLRSSQLAAAYSSKIWAGRIQELCSELIPMKTTIIP